MANQNGKKIHIWKKYKWLILMPLFKFIKDALFIGVNYRNSFTKIKLPSTNTQQYLSKHIFIHKLISYLFIFIIYSIINRITKGPWFCSLKEKIKKQSDEQKNISISIFLFIIFLWVVEETLNEIFKGIFFRILDVWINFHFL